MHFKFAESILFKNYFFRRLNSHLPPKVWDFEVENKHSALVCTATKPTSCYQCLWHLASITLPGASPMLGGV